MDECINYSKVAPEGIRPLSGLEAYVRSSGLEPGLLDLVKTRASQLNGCAYCIDMHTKDARAGGETEQRLYGLAAWGETPCYTDRDRAALARTEAVTLVSDGPVPDALYQEARRHFSEKELVDLTLALIAINAWNWLSISFRSVPGTYRSAARRQEVPTALLRFRRSPGAASHFRDSCSRPSTAPPFHWRAIAGGPIWLSSSLVTKWTRAPSLCCWRNL